MTPAVPGPPARLALDVATRLQDEGAVGVLVIGSVASGQSTADSDLDLLVVAPPDTALAPFTRTIEQGVLVEVMAKSEPGWVEHLKSSHPRWVYALLDGGEALVDDGAVSRLRAMAREVLAGFVTPPEVASEIATLLWHGRAKTARALASGDECVLAYWAAMLLPNVLDGLLALHHRPCVPGSRRLDVLAGVALDARDADLLRLALTGGPRDRLQAVAALAASLEPRLGPPDLERLEW